MTATVALPVPGAALRLGRSERTIWRQIRAGQLPVRREGRRVLVLLGSAEPEEGRLHRVGEASVAYGTSSEWVVGAFPYTEEVVERHRLAKLARRRAAGEEIKRLAALSRPDPDGLTAADYIRADRDHPRALEGGDAADRALERMARARRRRR